MERKEKENAIELEVYDPKLIWWRVINVRYIARPMTIFLLTGYECMFVHNTHIEWYIKIKIT